MFPAQFRRLTEANGRKTGDCPGLISTKLWQNCTIYRQSYPSQLIVVDRLLAQMTESAGIEIASLTKVLPKNLQLFKMMSATTDMVTMEGNGSQNASTLQRAKRWQKRPRIRYRQCKSQRWRQSERKWRLHNHRISRGTQTKNALELPNEQNTVSDGMATERHELCRVAGIHTATSYWRILEQNDQAERTRTAKLRQLPIQSSEKTDQLQWHAIQNQNVRSKWKGAQRHNRQAKTSGVHHTTVGRYCHKTDWQQCNELKNKQHF